MRRVLVRSNLGGIFEADDENSCKLLRVNCYIFGWGLHSTLELVADDQVEWNAQGHSLEKSVFISPICVHVLCK